MKSLLEFAGERSTYLRPSGGCHNCPRRKVDFVPPTLRDDNLILVGEAPGKTEVEEGEGFVGASGRLLREECTAVGITDFSCTNTIHCHPPANATPKPKEIQCCLSQFVLEEVRGYSWVVLVGTVPLTAFFPGAYGTHFRGNVAHHPDFPGQRFYSIYHPSYLLRRRDKKGEFQQQLQRLGRLVRGEAEPDWTTLGSEEPGFASTVEEIMAAPLVSLDIETTGVESWEPGVRVTDISLSADGKTVVVCNEGDGYWEMVLDRVRRYITDPRRAVVGSYVGFDLVFLEEMLGCRSRCQEHDISALYYETGRYKQPSLKELASRELDGYRFLVHEPHLFHDPVLKRQYSGEDAIHPLRLFQRGMREVGPRTRDLLVRVGGSIGHVLRRMTHTGIHLRQDYRERVMAEYEARRRKIVRAWKKADPDFIPTVHESGDGLQTYLFEIRGLPVVGQTEKGERSTDKRAIKEWIRQGHSILKHLLELREVDKILSTYLNAYDNHLYRDGRIHPSFTSTYTDTGRPSSRKPNLQNIPRNKVVRSLFGTLLGGAFGESDLSQIEFRIAVSLAQDENGIAGYLRGEDAHYMTAKMFAPKPTPEDRFKAKAVNFSQIYGGGAHAIQRSARDEFGLDWTDRQCQEFEQGFQETYPRFAPWHEQIIRDLQSNRGWFESVVGHVFYYSEWDHKHQGRREHVHRAVINSTCQGPAAQICFHILIQASRLAEEVGLPVRFVNTVHDSILWELPTPKQVPQLIALLEEACERTYQWIRPWFQVPLVMDHKAGEAWGDLVEIET